MKKILSIKKVTILATLLFIFTFAIPLTSSVNNVTDGTTLDIIKDIDGQENVAINFHMFGIPSKLSKEITVPRFQAEELYDKIKELQTGIASNPKSEEVKQLQEEIADFTLKYDLLPKDLSQKLVSSGSNLKESKIFNLLSTSKSSSRSASEFLCNFVSTGSGTSLPIIVLPRVIPFLLSPIPRALMIWNTKEGDTSCGGLYSNTGFIARGEQNGIAIGFWGVGFTFNLPPIQGYGVLGYALYANVNAEQILYFPPNNPPVISIPNPTNHEQNVPLTLSKLSFHIGDEDNDIMSYTVTTEPNIGSGSGNLKRDGDYSISVSNLELSTEYKWTVKVDDGKDTTTSTFSFTTVKKEPVISNPYPSDYSSAQITLTELRFDIFDAQGDLMDYTVETSPDIGSKSGYDASYGTIIVPVSGLKDDNWYRWYVNVTDGAHWTREVFSFFTGDFGLVGYWSFDEGDGNTAHDSSGNDNHGTIHGASWTTGISGSALEFDGQSDYLQVPDSDSLDLKTNAFTIAAWINADSFFGEGGHNGNPILCKWQTSKVGQYFFTAYSGGSLKLLIADGNIADYVSTFGILSTNEWNFVAALWDGTTTKLFVNGELAAENSTTISSLYQEHYYSDYVEIGHSTGGSYPYWFFDGTIDEVRIYNRALSESEIFNLYTNN